MISLLGFSRALCLATILYSCPLGVYQQREYSLCIRPRRLIPKSVKETESYGR